MRTVSITIYNNQELEVFVEKREDAFELWVVGPIKGRRMVLGHRITHDDVEAHLEYAQPGDLVWRDASPSGIPDEKHRIAIKEEKFMIERGIFWDNTPDTTVTFHLKPIEWLTTDRKEANAAKKALLGQWTDGIITMSLEPNHKLVWSCTDPMDFLGDHSYAPDWWNIVDWTIIFKDSDKDRTTATVVLIVNDQELHLERWSREIPLHRLARVFHRIGSAVEQIEEAVDSGESPDSSVKPERVSRAAGETIPLLRQLEQVVIDRNPLLAERLNRGLPESEVRDALSQAKVEGDIEALIQLYSWSNGTAVGENDSMDEISFFPQDTYRFMDLEEAISSWRALDEAVETLQEMTRGTREYSLFSRITGQFFPIFTDGGPGMIAVDLTPSKRNRVMLVDFEFYGRPLQAYSSFTAFIKDAIRASKEDDNLKSFQNL